MNKDEPFWRKQNSAHENKDLSVDYNSRTDSNWHTRVGNRHPGHVVR